jgi:CheY-like chemotaxis protein
MPHVILFVDDEPDVLDLLRRTFPAADGYEALTAADPDEALRILGARDVELLVTDQRMSGMTGVELVERARRARPDLCAILLTAYTEPKDIVAAINRGQVYRYVVKPWDKDDITRRSGARSSTSSCGASAGGWPTRPSGGSPPSTPPRSSRARSARRRGTRGSSSASWSTSPPSCPATWPRRSSPPARRRASSSGPWRISRTARCSR